MRHLILCLALSLWACDDGGSGSATTLGDGGAADAGSADMGELTQDQAIAAFCQDAAAARCGWAFECVGPEPSLQNVLGLAGPFEANCVEAAAASCLADAQTLTERGTLEFVPSAAEKCVEKLAAAPCSDDPPADWVSDYNKYVTNQCRGALKGAAKNGEACTDRLDCSEKNQICADGTCRAAEFTDLTTPCDTTGSGPGSLATDASCAGGVCAEVQDNDEDVSGICSVDCRSGFGCPSESYCLQFNVAGDRTHFFCTKPCTTDAQCGDALSCVAISDDPNQKHCFVTPSE